MRWTRLHSLSVTVHKITAMATLLYILLATIFVIAVEFAYFLFRKTSVYSLLRNSLWRFSEKLMRFLFG